MVMFYLYFIIYFLFAKSKLNCHQASSVENQAQTFISFGGCTIFFIPSPAAVYVERLVVRYIASCSPLKLNTGHVSLQASELIIPYSAIREHE